MPGWRASRFEARVVGADGTMSGARSDSPGGAARLVHDAVWAGAPSGEVWSRGRRRQRLTSMRRVAARAVELTNHRAGTVQYEYNPSTARPDERHWSPVWPPEGIPYSEDSGIA
jgi:hypothetical protein